MPLQESSYEVVSADQNSRVGTMTAIVQIPPQTEIAPRMMGRFRWQSVIFHTSVFCLQAWSCYYVFTGVRDTYSKSVFYYTSLVFYLHSIAMAAIVSDGLRREPRMRPIFGYPNTFLLVVSGASVSFLAYLEYASS